MFKSLVDAFCSGRRQVEAQQIESEYSLEAEAWEKHLHTCRQQLADVVSERFATEKAFRASKARVAAQEAHAVSALRSNDEALAREIALSIIESDRKQKEFASRLLSLRHRENRLQEILGNSQRLWRGYRNELELSQTRGGAPARISGQGNSSSDKLRIMQASLARKRQQEAMESVGKKSGALQQALGTHPDLTSVEIRQPLEDVLGRLRKQAASPDEN